jgi:hypothetical protein
MSSECEVRAFAGAFVLVSLVLGLLLSRAWFAFTAFVGANLLQSGFTGFCPLELLARAGVGEGPASPAERR